MLDDNSRLGVGCGGASGMNGMSRMPATNCVPTAMPRAGTALAQRFMYAPARP